MSAERARTYDYDRDGVLFPLPALDDDEIEACRQALAAIEAVGQPRAKRLLSHKSHLVSRTLFDVARKDAILDRIEEVIGPDILVWGAGFFNKAPGSSDYVSWHQDATYWGLEPLDIVTAWIALTPSTPESGCMRVVPGSHSNPILEHADTYAAGNLLSRGQEVAVEVKEEEAVDVVLQPGQMSLHHVLIVHGSKPNRSQHPRLGYVVRYIGGHVRQTQKSRDSATLVRGRNRAGTFELERAPSGELDDASLAYHQSLST